MCLAIPRSKNYCGLSMFGFLVCLSFVRRLFAFFGGLFVSLLFCLGGSVSVACAPFAALFFLFFSSLSLGGRPGRGLLFLLRFLPCALRSRNLRRYRHVLACCALPPSPLFSFPPVSPLPPRRGRPPLFPAGSLFVFLSLRVLVLSLFSSLLFFFLSVCLSLFLSLHARVSSCACGISRTGDEGCT